MPPKLSRRQALKALLLGSSMPALAKLLLTKPAPLIAQDDASTVIIIGAGVAGLTAGRLLQAEGFTVTMLEARNRYGGRVWTDRSLGVPLDMGASWQHGTQGSPLTPLINQLGIRTVITDYDNIAVYDDEGNRFDEDDLEEYAGAFEALIEAAYAISEDSDTDMPLSRAIAAAVDELDEELTTAERQVLAFAINSVIEHEYAASADQLSAWWWDEADDYGGDDRLFPDGYDWLTTYLATGLDILISTPVTRISYSDDGVQIDTSNGTFSADYALVTVPVGVLKAGSITFQPALPADKRAAIANLHSGVLNKLYLRFDRVFWDEDVTVIGHVDAAQRGYWSETLNLAPVIGQPILLCFNAGDFGLETEALSDADVIESAMGVLRTIYGDNIPAPTGYLRTSWGRDPYAMGSYSSYGVGSSPDDREALAAPIDDVLFFAGEATERDHPSTVHGAMLSGQRAADEIIDADA